MKTLIWIRTVFVLLQCLAPAACLAQETKPSSPPFQVATRALAPFVVQGTDGKLSGFSIDLWEAIGQELGRESRFMVRPNVQELLNTVQGGQAQIGIAAIWWAMSCLGQQAEEMPKRNFSRVLAVFWMYFAIIFIAFVTAALTANLTLQQLRGDIRGPQDLPGKRVGTVAPSTTADYLKEERVNFKSYTDVDGAIAALESGNLDAVVYDAPILLYFAANKGKGSTSVVGPVFKKEDYGIVFPQGSPWRRPVNIALLRLKENGQFDRIQEKWFGLDAPQ